MIAEAGHFALILALFIAIIQASIPMVGAHHGNALWMSFDKPTAIAQMLMITIAFACLTYSHVISDFSVLNVCLLYTSPSPRDRTRSRMPSSA